jgi:methyl-accepting chemotaxis protein
MAESLSTEAKTAREETSRQTDSVMQISAAMEELTVSVTEVADRAREISEASERTRAIARESAAAVSDSARTTQRALQAAASSGGAIGDLSAEIHKISDITKVIKEIADQTNLLALNAAIEAARAGESGRGFAVVADEVRKLAERTTVSTTDITSMIAAIQIKAETAVTAMGTVSADVQQGADQTQLLHGSFTRILDAAEKLTMLAGEIAHGAAEQSNVAQETARNMESISQASERTGGSVAQVAATATDTAKTAQELKALVSRFRVAS